MAWIIDQPYLWWNDLINDYSLKALTDEVIDTKRAKATKMQTHLVEVWTQGCQVEEFDQL